MAKLLKLRRGTTSQHSSFTGAEGEVTVDTTKDTIVVHDGSTAGGVPLAKESDNLSLIDEDNMSSNSATRPPSQQSVKAYVDGLTGVPTSITVADESSDTTCFPLFVTAATGDQAPKTGSNFTFNSATGKVVIGGDLQVQGTTTTVDSTTMSVADKNIELAKGAANDAAADGGGITLVSGDGNKTFNWVDATDAWTSSEHIHIGDTPKLLLGTDQDAEINHNGSNLFIQNTTGNININPKANETAILCVPDGTVELYHDNIRTFRTDTNGVSVFGPEAGNAALYLYADEADDNADCWRLSADTSGNFKVGNKSTGSYVEGITLDGSNNATFAGTVSDSKGDVRKIPANVKTSAYTLIATDTGKLIDKSGSGAVEIPNNVFSLGDTVSILNNSGSDLTITATITTLYNCADAATGNRTLAGRGLATIYFTGGTSAYISGAGLS